MKISFVKNIQFSKLVKVSGQLREFNFRKVAGESVEKFTVDYNDDRNRRIVFSLQKNEGAWKILPTAEVPDSIVESEKVFDELIAQELTEIQNS